MWLHLDLLWLCLALTAWNGITRSVLPLSKFAEVNARSFFVECFVNAQSGKVNAYRAALV